jgi:hypothetical protein
VGSRTLRDDGELLSNVVEALSINPVTRWEREEREAVPAELNPLLWKLSRPSLQCCIDFDSKHDCFKGGTITIKNTPTHIQ